MLTAPSIYCSTIFNFIHQCAKALLFPICKVACNDGLSFTEFVEHMFLTKDAWGEDESFLRIAASLVSIYPKLSLSFEKFLGKPFALCPTTVYGRVASCTTIPDNADTATFDLLPLQCLHQGVCHHFDGEECHPRHSLASQISCSRLLKSEVVDQSHKVLSRKT